MTDTADYLSNRFGNLCEHLKSLKKWSEVELGHIKDARDAEKELEEAIRKIELLKTERNKRIKAITDNLLRKFRGLRFGDIKEGDQRWLPLIKQRFPDFFTEINEADSLISRRKNQAKEYEKKTEFSINKMTEDIQRIHDICKATYNDLENIMLIAPTSYFEALHALLEIIEDESKKTLGLISCIKLEETRQNAQNADIVAKTRESMNTMRELLDQESIDNIKIRIQDMKERLTAAKHNADPDNLLINQMQQDGVNYTLMISGRAQRVVMHNTDVRKKLLERMPMMITRGIALRRGGQNTSALEATSGKQWRLLNKGIMEGKLDGGARVYYGIEEDRVLVGDIFLPGQHEHEYKESITQINNGKYSLDADKDLKIMLRVDIRA